MIKLWIPSLLLILLGLSLLYYLAFAQPLNKAQLLDGAVKFMVGLQVHDPKQLARRMTTETIYAFQGKEKTGLTSSQWEELLKGKVSFEDIQFSFTQLEESLLLTGFKRGSATIQARIQTTKESVFEEEIYLTMEKKPFFPWDPTHQLVFYTRIVPKNRDFLSLFLE